jgi:hypothetical protein
MIILNEWERKDYRKICRSGHDEEEKEDERGLHLYLSGRCRWDNRLLPKPKKE